MFIKVKSIADPFGLRDDKIVEKPLFNKVKSDVSKTSTNLLPSRIRDNPRERDVH